VAYFAGNLLSAVVWSVQCLEIVEAEVSQIFMVLKGMARRVYFLIY